MAKGERSTPVTPEVEGAQDAEGVEDAGPIASVEPRILAAWRQWLGALATDAEAAIAAAHVYGELAPDARDAWLDALHEDEAKLDVPRVAIYAPLLSVEADPGRRKRIEQAIGPGASAGLELGGVRALRGLADDGTRVAALVSPLYLSFVRVLWCRYDCDQGFVWARHDPILGERDAPSDGALVDDVILEATPLNPVIEDLAHAVLAQRRRGGEMPRSLQLFAHLFDAHVEAEGEL